MKKDFIKKILSLKLGQTQAKINLNIEEEDYFSCALNYILSTLKLDELIELKNSAECEYIKAKELKKNLVVINKQLKDNDKKTSTFDAKSFYDASSKTLAYESLIKDCQALIDKLNNKNLQF